MDSISRETKFFSSSPFSRRGNLFFFLCTLTLSELNYIAIRLCSKELDFIFLLNRFVVYSLPTPMSSLTGNHAMDLFDLLKENFKKLPFHFIISGRGFENFDIDIVLVFLLLIVSIFHSMF